MKAVQQPRSILAVLKQGLIVLDQLALFPTVGQSTKRIEGGAM